MEEEDYAFHAVSDTNILLSTPKAVWQGIAEGLGLHGVSCLMHVPYAVLQELDGLKSNSDKQVGKDARQALRFLEEESSGNLENVGYSWVGVTRGAESSRPLRWHVWTTKAPADPSNEVQVTNADDEILSITLAVRRMAARPTLLLTNDRGLVIKSTAVGIPALPLSSNSGSADETRAVASRWMEALSRAPPPPPEAMSFVEAEGASEVLSAVSSDEVFWSVMSAIEEELSPKVQLVFSRSLGDAWKECLKIPLPWTIVEIVQLIDLHWSAVFREKLLPRGINLQQIREIERDTRELLGSVPPSEEDWAKWLSRVDTVARALADGLSLKKIAQTVLLNLQKKADSTERHCSIESMEAGSWAEPTPMEC